MGTESQFGMMKSPTDGQWSWSHNNMNIFNATELYT